MKVKAVILFSGGLDSILSARIMAEQKKVESIIFHCYTVFSHNSREETEASLSAYARELGLRFEIIDFSLKHIALVKNPLTGFGSNVNPCIDCKLAMFQAAKAYMEEIGACFLVSGEVIGQRPMSQRKDVFNRIEKIAGLKGRILRPLCAKLLEPTIAEEKGWVKRDLLYDIQSRSRKKQAALAEKFEIKTYPNPGGGCLLTDPGYSRRIKDLLKYQPDFSAADVALLRLGRHFRIAPQAKLIVPRDVHEADLLDKMISQERIRFVPASFDGYASLGRGEFREEDLYTAASIATQYYPDSMAKTVKVIDGDKQTLIRSEQCSPVLRGRYLI